MWHRGSHALPSVKLSKAFGRNYARDGDNEQTTTASGTENGNDEKGYFDARMCHQQKISSATRIYVQIRLKHNIAYSLKERYVSDGGWRERVRPPLTNTIAMASIHDSYSEKEKMKKKKTPKRTENETCNDAFLRAWAGFFFGHVISFFAEHTCAHVKC